MSSALRTNIKLSDGLAFSFKQSDFDPIPPWYEKLYINDEITGKSIKAMGFHTLKFAHFGCCYSGRLVFRGGRLVEGPFDNTGLAFDVPNDMAMALGIGVPENPESFYQGWYDRSSIGEFSMYSKFNMNEWDNLRDGYTFYAALLFAIMQDTQMDHDTHTYPSSYLRLFGGGEDLYFYLYGLE
jgi:hypothetical protein